MCCKQIKYIRFFQSSRKASGDFVLRVTKTGFENVKKEKIVIAKIGIN
jgi:hypothetical protein